VLLDRGVFTAAEVCLLKYDKSTFKARSEQRFGEARSIVDFHVLVNKKLVAIVEAKSPTVMHRLGELLTRNINAFELRWTKGSRNLVSQVFSRVGIRFLIRE